MRTAARRATVTVDARHVVAETRSRARAPCEADAKRSTKSVCDRRVDAELEEMGWRVLRPWDFEVVRNPAAAALTVIEKWRES